MHNLYILALLCLCYATQQKKIIAVTGATGMQGGAVVKAILADPTKEFTCRAVCRNTDSEKAKELADKGCEIVAGSFDDVESLKKAFAGAYGVFGVTNYWEHLDVKKEIQQGKNIALAAKENKVAHTVWSTLDSVKDILTEAKDDTFTVLEDGMIVPHWEGKAEITKFMKEIGLPVTNYYTSFYLENLYFFGMLQYRDGQWSIALNMGDAKLAVVALDDLGKGAYAAFKDKKYIGKDLHIANDELAIQELVDKLNHHLGTKIVYVNLSDEVYSSLPFPGAADLANMVKFDRKYEKLLSKNGRNREASKKFVPDLQSVDSWIAEHKQVILDYMSNAENKQKASQKSDL